MIKINLLPVRAAQKKEKLRSQVSILMLSLIGVSIVCGAVYFRMMTKIEARTNEISSVESEINQLKKQIGEVSRYKKLQTDLTKKLEILQVLKDSRSGPVHLLDELNKALPDKLWLTDYSVAGDSVKIDGIAADENVVASFMERLGASAYYTQVELNGISQLVMNQVKLQKFTLTCRAIKPVK
ncbi:PilN domain-containing protein [Geopsychrobacter electrodiphilus]|uniref:PilN domain-containing protein n=1 Tax=Geopsychrobacter electrodiphilus TaxID=225196 RepID=UPI00035F2B18|nr:PilN domain-containing protein [Geopsychrobacter electrodiphilus]